MHTNNLSFCKGLVFKGTVSTFFSNNKIQERKALTLLKRKSCSCPKCDFVLDQLKEFDFGYSFSLLNEVEDGRLYKLIPSFDYDFMEEFDLIQIGE